MSSRIYVCQQGETTRLVRAKTPQSARSFVAESTIRVAVASQDDIVAAVSAGVKVEETVAGPVQSELGE